ncbi:MAG: glycosyltransferase, partial [Fibrobacter sp.]|nr:glycosyltransferase [Fibrobacter sp.]
CCIPSSYEGFGVPAIEAMGCGTAVVASHSAGIDEIVTDGVNGLLCTPQMLGETLKRALSDQKLRRSLVRGGILRSREFDISLIASRYEMLYEKVKHLNTGA